MSRKRKKPKRHLIELEVGKFYNVHDGSNSGPPGRIEYANKQEDIYISITTGSMTEKEYLSKPFRKDYKELTHTTTSSVFKSFIHKRPFKGSRDDYGETEYCDMHFHKSDHSIIRIVLKRKPRLGYWLKQKNKKPSK